MAKIQYKTEQKTKEALFWIEWKKVNFLTCFIDDLEGKKYIFFQWVENI